MIWPSSSCSRKVRLPCNTPGTPPFRLAALAGGGDAVHCRFDRQSSARWHHPGTDETGPWHSSLRRCRRSGCRAGGLLFPTFAREFFADGRPGSRAPSPGSRGPASTDHVEGAVDVVTQSRRACSSRLQGAGAGHHGDQRTRWRPAASIQHDVGLGAGGRCRWCP